MNPTDERLERYLRDRSTTIDLPHAGVDAISRRARRHRRRRTAACGGVAAALLVGGVAVALRQPPPDEQVGSVGSSVIDSPLEWSLVDARSGIGWGSGATSDGSSVYSLSTSPGAESEGESGEPRRLYRSDDGTDWEQVDLPEGLFASSLAGADGAIYAVGTAAAGGEAGTVELSSSVDGGSGWDTSTVPVDLAALAEGFPGRVRAVDAEVAVADGTTVVVVSIAGSVDPTLVLGDEPPPDSWYQDVGGMVRAVESTCAPAPSTTAPASGEASSTEDPVATDAPTTLPPQTTEPDAPPVTAGVDPAGRGAEACAGGADTPEPETRTWAELGLTPEQAAIADGQTRTFVAVDGGDLEPVDTRPGASYSDPSMNRLLAADDGFWLISDKTRGDVPDLSTDVVAFHSSDGRTWTETTIGTGQSAVAAGVVGGRPVVMAFGNGGDQVVDVHRIEPGGAVTSTDVNDLVGLPPRVGIYGWGVGPLGVAVVMGDDVSGDEEGLVVVTSLDGLQFSRDDLPEAEPGTRQSVNGITVTPDAIKVRLNVRDGDSQPVGPPDLQRLFVGSRAG